MELNKNAYGIVGVRPNSNIVDGPSTVLLYSGEVESGSARMFGVIDEGRLFVDEPNHVIFPITDMVSQAYTANPVAIQ